MFVSIRCMQSMCTCFWIIVYELERLEEFSKLLFAITGTMPCSKWGLLTYIPFH